MKDCLFCFVAVVACHSSCGYCGVKVCKKWKSPPFHKFYILFIQSCQSFSRLFALLSCTSSALFEILFHSVGLSSMYLSSSFYWFCYGCCCLQFSFYDEGGSIEFVTFWFLQFLTEKLIEITFVKIWILLSTSHWGQ